MSATAAAPERGLSLLVIIPCLNESATATRVVQGGRQIPGVTDIRVLVMDDGSSDSTTEDARSAGAAVSSNATTQGLGLTFREAVGVAVAREVDLVVHIDGDGQFDPSDIPTLVAPLVNGTAHMVTASRFLEERLMPKMPMVKRLGNRGVSRIVQILTGHRFRDVSCGFRVFSREALLRISLFGTVTYTQECFLHLIFKNLAIVEIPVKVRGTREFGSSRVAPSLFRYGTRSLQIMLRAFISYSPFALLFALTCVFLLLGLGFLSSLAVHYVRTSAFSPHIWAGFVGGSFVFLAMSTFVSGLLGDILVRILLNQRHILYRMERSPGD